MFGAVGETRTLTGNPHALKRARLPFQHDRFNNNATINE